MAWLWTDKQHTQLKYKSDKLPGIIWAQELGDADCPYLKRWVFNFGKFAIRLHHWIGSDDPRYHHDHPWGFYTLILKGGYTDVSQVRPDLGLGKTLPDTRQHLSAGTITYREPHHTHTVQTDPGGAWTLLLTGPFKRKWGFWVDGKFVGVREYFRKYGHHPCED